MDLEKIAKLLAEVDEARRRNIEETMAAVNEMTRKHIDVCNFVMSSAKDCKEEDKMSDDRNDYDAMIDGYDKNLNNAKSNKAIPPDDAVPPKEDAQGSRIADMMIQISNRLKAHTDFMKKTHEVVMETHKMSFNLCKEMDEYIDARRKRRGSQD